MGASVERGGDQGSTAPAAGESNGRGGGGEVAGVRLLHPFLSDRNHLFDLSHNPPATTPPPPLLTSTATPVSKFRDSVALALPQSTFQNFI